MKAFITNIGSQITLKGVDSRVAENYSDYVVLTNNRYTIPIKQGNRRIFAVECSNRYTPPNYGVEESRNHFAGIFEEDAGLRGLCFYKWLTSSGGADFGDILKMEMPKSNYMESLAMESVPLIVEFVIHLYELRFRLGDRGFGWIPYKKIYGFYKDWVIEVEVDRKMVLGLTKFTGSLCSTLGTTKKRARSTEDQSVEVECVNCDIGKMEALMTKYKGSQWLVELKAAMAATDNNDF